MVKHHHLQKCCWSGYCLTASLMQFYLPQEDVPIYFFVKLQSGNPQLYCCIISNMQMRLDGYRARESVCNAFSRKFKCYWKTAAMMRLRTWAKVLWRTKCHLYSWQWSHSMVCVWNPQTEWKKWGHRQENQYDFPPEDPDSWQVGECWRAQQLLTRWAPTCS